MMKFKSSKEVAQLLQGNKNAVYKRNNMQDTRETTCKRNGIDQQLADKEHKNKLRDKLNVRSNQTWSC